MVEVLGSSLDFPLLQVLSVSSGKRGRFMKARVEFSLTVLVGLVLFVSMISSMSAPASMQEENLPADDSFHQDQKAKMEKARRDEAFRKLKDGSDQLYKATGELKEM